MTFLRDPSDRRFRHFCVTGDPNALGDVFDRTAGRLLRVALWLHGNQTDAEDLLQRTFLKAIETRAQFRPGEPVLPWLMGLLGNEARRQRRERDRAAAVRSVQDRVVDPEAAVVARELADTVRSVGDRLAPPYRDVLRLHLEGGLSCKEIAARLDRPSGTVRTQLMRGLDLLRRRLPGGFVAGSAAVAVAGSGALSSVRAAVTIAAHEAAPTAVAAAATAGAALGGPSLTKGMLLSIAAMALLGGTAVFVALGPGGTTLPLSMHAAAANASRQPNLERGAGRRHERLPFSDPLQDPKAVALPRLALLGAMPDGDPALVLTADGRRSAAAAPDTALTSVLLRIDRNAPWQEVTRLLDELRSQGIEQVQFAAQLPSGEAGCFTLALPANDKAGPAIELRLHRERAGIPPSSFVPVLRRIARGRQEFLAGLGEREMKELSRRFPAPFVVSVRAPDDAPFEQALQVVAAASQAGVRSMLVASSGPSAADAGQPTSPDAGWYAIDLGPLPQIAITARTVRLNASGVTDAVVGCPDAAFTPRPEGQVGGAGGFYGSRNNSPARAARRAELYGTPSDPVGAGIAWLTAAQQPDGNYLGDDGRADLQATALAMLVLLGQGTRLGYGDFHEQLSRGIGWILDQQDDDGCFAPGGHRNLRHHALATYAVAETYGLSHGLEVRGSLLDALAWLGKQQQDDGGFTDGTRGARSDVASTGAVVMALMASEYFSVEVPTTTKKVMAWFDSAEPADDPTAAATELFCRFVARQEVKQQTELVAKAERLLANADPMDPWCQYWASDCLFQMGGELWKTWLVRLGDVAKLQHRDDAHSGSWEPAYGNSRVTTTALRLLALQSHCRYSRLFR